MGRVKVKPYIILKKLIENDDLDKTIRFICNKYECCTDTAVESKKIYRENPNITAKELKKIIDKIIYK